MMRDRSTGLFHSCVLLITVLTFTGISSAPVQRRSINTGDSHGYLKKYGYMTTDNPTGNEVADAMVSMQRFFGLDETGQLDQATMDAMSEPRCGVADFHPDIVLANCSTPGDGTSCRRRRYTLLGAPWDSTALTYRFNNYTPDLSRSQVQSAIERALGVWAEVTPLTFTRKTDGTSLVTASDIEVVFGSGNHGISHPADGAFDGSSRQGGTVLAHAFNPGTVRFADLRGDMHFDEDELWQDAAGIDLFTVAAHEFGHSLGLGHSSIRGALMFPTYYGYNPNFRLHADDVQGIQVLYGPRPSTQSPTTKGPRPSTQSPTTPTTPIASTTAMTSATMKSVDYCDSSYDTIATLQNVFDDVYTVAIKDESFIRFTAEDTILSDAFTNVEQSPFDAIFRESQMPLTALLEKDDGSLVVIRGTMYWEYLSSTSSVQLKRQFPKPLSSIGLPENVNITAALSEREEGKVYLFSDIQYWSFDGNLNTVDLGSPKPIEEKWPGVPSGFNAAFNFQDNTCFVKDTQYWCFNETSSEVGSEFPRSFNTDWLGCDMSGSSSASSFKCQSGSCVIYFFSLVVVLMSIYHPIL